MKRIMKFLARLYPSAWRRRYKVEYEALLEQGTPRAQDAVDVLWTAVKLHATSRDIRRIVLPCAIAGALTAAAISFAVQPRYVSQTVILVTTPGSGSDTVAPNSADASFRVLEDMLLTDTSLARIIQKLDLYPRERTRMSQEDVIQRMRRDIDVAPVTNGSDQTALALRFSYPDPRVAQRVETELVSATMTSTLRLRMNHSSIPPEVFSVLNAPNLPLAPSFPNREVFGTGGLFAGIVGGLMLTAVMRRRRHHRH